jgi:hypothetical protein
VARASKQRHESSTPFSEVFGACNAAMRYANGKTTCGAFSDSSPRYIPQNETFVRAKRNIFFGQKKHFPKEMKRLFGTNETLYL